jgi:flap endonuclease-1
MGIKNLFKLIKMESKDSIKDIDFNNIHMRKIAIDTSIVLYQYVVAIRSRGADLKTSNDMITSHIYGILSKAVGLIEKGILPIFVFDGKPPAIKQKILDNRKKLRNEAKKALETISDDEERIKMLKKSVVITRKQMEECKEVLRLMGLPVIEAPEEADSQCAYLSKKKLTYGVASEDMDLLTFGTPYLLRNFSVSKKKQIKEISLKKILEGFKMTMDQFIDLCILLGCDYTPTIKGIGTKKAFSFMKEYGSIEGIIEAINKKELKRYKIPENFNYQEARDYFKDCINCKVERNELNWSKPDLEKLSKYLSSFEFDDKKIKKYCKRISNFFTLYNKRRKKILEQKAGKKMLSKLYKVKENNDTLDNSTSPNNSFKIDLVRNEI